MLKGNSFTLVTIVLAVVLAGPVPLRASEVVTVAAAADLAPAMPDLTALFERQTGARVRVSVGASGNLAQQIEHGAPFDVFLSADESYPAALVAKGLADAGDSRVYATGRLALWIAPGFGAGMDALRDARISRIAIANPRHAPYGRAAEACMKHFNVDAAVVSRIVIGENVAQAAQFLRSGAAQAGIVSISLAATLPQGGAMTLLPAECHLPLRQTVVVLRRASNPALARRFAEFMVSPEAQAVLARHGFHPTGEKR